MRIESMGCGCADGAVCVLLSVKQKAVLEAESLLVERGKVKVVLWEPRWIFWTASGSYTRSYGEARRNVGTMNIGQSLETFTKMRQ